MKARYPLPTGRLSAPLHGARMTLLGWARVAKVKSITAAESPEAAAALRGKHRAYLEAADLIAAIEQQRRLPQRWLRRRSRTG